ncbi:MAG: RNA polymerase sigma factor [Patescibacteria group bacterium]
MRKKQNNFLPYYNQYKDKIYNYFLYRVGFDKPLAEDLSSEVFIKALKSFADFDENKKFQSWIYMIAHNHLVNHYKTAGRVIPIEPLENSLYYIDKSAEERHELARVLEIIDAMENSESEILRFRFIDQLSNSEIAEILGKEEGAIRTQISRTLVKLREILNSKTN